MFNSDILEKIYSDKDMQKVPIGYMSTMIHGIETVLEDMGYDLNSKPKEEKYATFSDY